MCPLRRVDGEQAGPKALGLLVPPSKRTFVIIRPRSLDIDLVLVRSDGSDVFFDMTLDEAHAAAQMTFRALQAATPEAIQAVPAPEGSIYRLRVTLGSFCFLACSRIPGQPYVPATVSSAEALVQQLAGILCPSADIVQEVYFNTRHLTTETSRSN